MYDNHYILNQLSWKGDDSIMKFSLHHISLCGIYFNNNDIWSIVFHEMTASTIYMLACLVISYFHVIQISS